jgi:hypothetical protein
MGTIVTNIALKCSVTGYIDGLMIRLILALQEADG